MKFAFASGSRPLDGYTVKRGIHRGGFGEVYYAVSDGGKEVALKLLHDNLDVELRGVTQCLNLKHPNLVSLFDVREDDDGDHWIVMEYVSGKTLEQWLADRPPGLTVQEIGFWLDGMAAAVDFLHDRGIVHRDLKPGNVYCEGDVVKVGDVGLSKIISHSRHNAQTQSVGTVYYMAPEVAHGRYGAGVDIYSLGIMLYEMFVGDVPLNGETAAEIMMKHLTQPVDLRPIPEPFRPLLARMLAKDPADRPATAGEVAAEFARLARDPRPQTASSKTPTPIPESSFFGTKTPQRAAAGQPVAHTAHAQTKSDSSDRFWTYAAIAVFAAVLILPRMPRPVVVGAAELAMVGGLIYAVVVFGKKLFPPSVPFTGHATGPPPPRKPRHPQPYPHAKQFPHAKRVRKAVAKAARRPIAYLLSAKTPRHVPLQRRVAESTTAMAFSTVLVALFTAAVATFSTLLDGTGGTVDLGEAMLFASTAAVACWGVLLPAKWWEGHAGDAGTRRVAMLLIGLGVGASAYGLDQYLLADFNQHAYGAGAVFTSLGRQSLVTAAGQPSHWGCLLFFGALFALRPLWSYTDSFRTRRFRLWPVFSSIGIAWLLTVVWSFPQIYGMTLAATVASVVQLAAVWLPPEDRPAVMRETFHV